MSMPTAFVTGISGQDGGYLAERLLAEGSTVHGLVRVAAQVAPIAAAYPGVRLHVADLTDGAAVADLLARIVPDEVYNLAGISSVALSWREPVTTGRVSGLAAAGVLEASFDMADRTGRSIRVVQASSAEIFGNPAAVPQDESTPIVPVTPYGAAKAYAHHMVRVYRRRGLLRRHGHPVQPRVPAPPPDIRHPQDHPGRGHDRPG